MTPIVSPLEICTNKTITIPGANFYTHIFSTLKDSKKRKRPNTPASDLNHYIFRTSDMWWQQEMQLNALFWYEKPTEESFHVINLPNRFPIYSNVFESKTNRNLFCLTPGFHLASTLCFYIYYSSCILFLQLMKNWCSSIYMVSWMKKFNYIIFNNLRQQNKLSTF